MAFYGMMQTVIILITTNNVASLGKECLSIPRQNSMVNMASCIEINKSPITLQ